MARIQMRNPGTYPLYLGALGALQLMFLSSAITLPRLALALTVVFGLVAVVFPALALVRARRRRRERPNTGEGAAVYYSTVCVLVVLGVTWTTAAGIPL